MTVKIRKNELERKFAGLRLEAVAENGSFSGYASIFGKVDGAKDVVEPGAFRETLTARGTSGIRMLFQHDPNQPIGSWTALREDSKGLFVEGKLAMGVGRAQEVLELMRAGALDGLSIGFQTVQATKDARSGIRRIRKADLWEISIVTFPMQTDARVTRVKGMAGLRENAGERELPSIREFEKWLLRDAGLSRREAKIVIAKGFTELQRERDAAPGTLQHLTASLRRAALLFHP